VVIPWATVAPNPDSFTRPHFDASDPAAYPAAGWSIYDEIVRDAAARGIGLDFTIGSPAPLWATGPGAPPGAIHKSAWLPSATEFGEFMRALGTRYSGHYRPAGAASALPRVDFWAIWNEPNYGPTLAPQAIDHEKVEVSSRVYRELLDAAWAALLATGHGPSTDTILIGEVAPRGINTGDHPGNFSGMLPLRFIRALYCVDGAFRPLQGMAATLRGCPASSAQSGRFVSQNPGLFKASGFAVHPYQDTLAPNNPANDLAGDADFSQMSQLTGTLDRAAAAYGASGGMPIYSTEFGYNSPTFVTGPVGATFMNQAEYLSWLDPRIRSYDQYLLKDAFGHEFDTGLIAASGLPKPTFPAYRMPLWLPVTHANRGTALVVWGCVRPAPYYARTTGATQHVQIQFAPATGRFRTLRSLAIHDPHGYFVTDLAFPASGGVRLAWSSSGRTFFSRVQEILLK
jgi:hypothetical protein